MNLYAVAIIRNNEPNTQNSKDELRTKRRLCSTTKMLCFYQQMCNATATADNDMSILETVIGINKLPYRGTLFIAYHQYVGYNKRQSIGQIENFEIF